MALMGQAQHTPPRPAPSPAPPALTVGELIAKLQGYPPGIPVEVPQGDGFWEPCGTVTHYNSFETGELLMVQVGGHR